MEHIATERCVVLVKKVLTKKSNRSSECAQDGGGIGRDTQDHPSSAYHHARVFKIMTVGAVLRVLRFQHVEAAQAHFCNRIGAVGAFAKEYGELTRLCIGEKTCRVADLVQLGRGTAVAKGGGKKGVRKMPCSVGRCGTQINATCGQRLFGGAHGVYHLGRGDVLLPRTGA